MNKIKNLTFFLRDDIWRIRLNELENPQAFLFRTIRIGLITIRGFLKNKCYLKASALTFYTLMSIVPVAAIAFGIAKGFGFEKKLEALLYEKIAGQEEVIAQIVTYANSYLENTKGSMIAGIGLAVLFWTVIKLMAQIERSFNEIWRLAKHRTFGRKFGDYLAIMLMGPILVFLSNGVNFYITSRVTNITSHVALLGMVSPVIYFFLQLLPYTLIWILFTASYIIIPNTQVRFRSGLIAGIIAGSFFQLAQWLYIRFQISATSYNAIYGSFAALPLFLMWMQLSWLIVLFGTQLSFAHDKVEYFEFEPDVRNLSIRSRKIFALTICRLIFKKFSARDEPFNKYQLMQQLNLPLTLVEIILNDLIQCGFLIMVDNHDQALILPALDITSVTISQVINALEQNGNNMEAIITGLGDNMVETVEANKLLLEV